MKRSCDFSVDKVAIGQNKQRKLEEKPSCKEKEVVVLRKRAIEAQLQILGIKCDKFMLNPTIPTESSFQMAARKCQDMVRWSFGWIPKLFSNETEEKEILHPKAQRSPEKQTNKCLANSSGDESQNESQSKFQSESQSESRGVDNLDLRCLLSKEVKSVKTGRQFKALTQINQSEFRCMICEITICSKLELQPHFIHPRHERYEQYYKEVDSVSSRSQNDPRDLKARKRSREYSTKCVPTHEKQPHRNDFKCLLDISGHGFEEKLSDFGLPSMFGESRYGKKKYKRKPKASRNLSFPLVFLPENYSENISKDCQYGTEHQYNEESSYDRESSEEKGNNQNTPPDDDYSDYVPVTESPDNNDVEMPQENGEKNGKKPALPEKYITYDFIKDSKYYGNRPKGKFRPVIIDGCNVGHTYGQNKYRRKNFSAMGLWIAYQYFKNLGYENEDIIIVQRHISYRNLTDEDREIMGDLKDLGILKNDFGFGKIGGDLVRPDDDLFILKLASKLEGIGMQN